MKHLIIRERNKHAAEFGFGQTQLHIGAILYFPIFRLSVFAGPVFSIHRTLIPDSSTLLLYLITKLRRAQAFFVLFFRNGNFTTRNPEAEPRFSFLRCGAMNPHLLISPNLRLSNNPHFILAAALRNY
jgi:hypothetical protein